ncbi:hypothetical protein FXN63_10565 [Pigmentiphaga aceris]|uniref:DUF3592 domain-containing protein n=1 Tax=Pigmentiphaga aceris TaxID=1940612 RepID=A0A5C0AUX5_9BURK|nr:hypothetical protein [Pigmentiphaga aceris]QEI06232.1 hypothetical protein FXN63_10565 [Pigmentiphaga aceris]
MDDIFNVSMGLMTLLAAPLLLSFWLLLMSGLGSWVVEGARDMFRPHSLIEAQIVDQRKISARIHARKISRIGVRNIYLLRYEFDNRIYEIEYLVTEENNVNLDKQARSLTLYVPHDQPGNARAEANTSQLFYGLIAIAALIAASWMTAPFLLFWKL